MKSQTYNLTRWFLVRPNNKLVLARHWVTWRWVTCVLMIQLFCRCVPDVCCAGRNGHQWRVGSDMLVSPPWRALLTSDPGGQKTWPSAAKNTGLVSDGVSAWFTQGRVVYLDVISFVSEGRKIPAICPVGFLFFLLSTHFLLLSSHSPLYPSIHLFPSFLLLVLCSFPLWALVWVQMCSSSSQRTGIFNLGLFCFPGQNVLSLRLCSHLSVFDMKQSIPARVSRL